MYILESVIQKYTLQASWNELNIFFFQNTSQMSVIFDNIGHIDLIFINSKEHNYKTNSDQSVRKPSTLQRLNLQWFFSVISSD